MVELKKSANEREVFFGERDHDKQGTDLFRLNGLPNIRQSKDLERNFCARQIIFLGQHVDNFGIRYSTDHADRASLQAVNAVDGRSRRRDDQYDHMTDDDDSLRLRQVADIAANHSEIDLIRRESSRRL